MKHLWKTTPIVFILTINVCTQTEDLEFMQHEIFPQTKAHTHGSTIAELPNGDLLAAWFQGSGERWADDVRIMGARLIRGGETWSQPFLMADVPEFPDINPVLFLDKQDRLWLVWYTVIANQWETSLPTYRISTEYMQKSGPPVWDWQQTLFVKPGDRTERGMLPDDKFVQSVDHQTKAIGGYLKDSINASEQMLDRWERWRSNLLEKASGEDMKRRGYYIDENGQRIDGPMGYPYFRRMGWQTKNKAVFTGDSRMILPLYSDGFSFSLMAITDDGGAHWQFSEPLVGLGNIQASIAEKRDGSLVAYMRDNGPPPKRLMVSESNDMGLTWSMVRDSELLNEGSGADIITLENGNWVLAYNDTEDGRHSLAIALSTDEGETWSHARHLELDNRESNVATQFAYPSIIQGKNGVLHVVYSLHRRDAKGGPNKTIRYARLTEDWIREGD